MATTNTKTTPATEIPATAQKIREQLLSTIRQGQQLSVDGAQTWAKAVSVLPVVEMPAIPGVPALPGIEAAAKFTFDLASDLLTAQRDFTMQLANAFTPQKSA
ncbi:MAG: hypothetical protein ABI438_04230 [Dermatophilaceae bacterium]